MKKIVLFTLLFVISFGASSAYPESIKTNNDRVAENYEALMSGGLFEPVAKCGRVMGRNCRRICPECHIEWVADTTFGPLFDINGACECGYIFLRY